jgi:hypothetical protein
MSGRGTASGVVFQGEVGARVAGLILTERPLSRIFPNVPGAPRRVLFETPALVDDVLVQTDIGEVYVQAKRTISLSTKKGSDLASVVAQFARQFRAGLGADGARRTPDPARDRFLLIVGEDTATPIARDLREVLERHRTGAANITQATCAKGRAEELEIRSIPHEYGFICYVDPICDNGPVPEDMLPVLALARECGCVWVNFDQDAGALEGVPEFEW